MKNNKNFKYIIIFLLLSFLIFMIFFPNTNEKFKTLPFHDIIKIDVVYTWVNSDDKKWKKKYKKWKKKATNLTKSSKAKNRFKSLDELKYSLKSLYRYAPWINNIYIVVADGQKPRFVNFNHEKIFLINHSEIFKDDKHLPTFNSHAIESNLTNIKGLSEYFIYFNDDIFLGKTLSPQHLYTKDKNGSIIPYFFGHEKKIKSNRKDGHYLAWKNIIHILKKDQILDNNIVMKPFHFCRFYKKSLINDIQKLFNKHFILTSSSKFRSKNDIDTLGLVYSYCFYSNHYKYDKNLQYNTLYIGGISDGIRINTTGESDINIFVKNENLREKLKEFLLEKNYNYICVNDLARTTNENITIIKEILDQLYSFKCPYIL